MVASLDEIKLFLRLDSNDEDNLLTSLEATAESIVADIARADLSTFSPLPEIYRIAVLYAVTNLYENRESDDHHALMLTLRNFLFGERVSVF